MNKNGDIKSAKRIFKLAKKEYEIARKTKNEMKARQSAEKGYLCLLTTVNALLVKSGIKEEELPQNERGRTYFLQKYADREFRKSYDAIYKLFHIDTFHEGIIEHKKLQERFEDLEELISKVENENT